MFKFRKKSQGEYSVDDNDITYESLEEHHERFVYSSRRTLRTYTVLLYLSLMSLCFGSGVATLTLVDGNYFSTGICVVLLVLVIIQTIEITDTIAELRINSYREFALYDSIMTKRAKQAANINREV